jgi:hypothetical protein
MMPLLLQRASLLVFKVAINDPRLQPRPHILRFVTTARCAVRGGDDWGDSAVIKLYARDARARNLAPELVEALREVLSWWPEGSEKLPALTKGTAFESDIQRARALLAKIDGDEA